MPDAKLTSDEIRVLRAVLAALRIKTRTGEVGVPHGLDRFVAAGVILTQADRATLDAAARKLGLAAGIRPFGG